MIVEPEKGGDVCAAKIEGRQLAPAIFRFDNERDVETLLERSFVPCESVSFDCKWGVVTWEPGGFARIGDWLVVDGKSLKRYESVDSLWKEYPSLCL